jgi:hypothetical protein
VPRIQKHRLTVLLLLLGVRACLQGPCAVHPLAGTARFHMLLHSLLLLLLCEV